MQRCLLEVPGVLCKEMNDGMFAKILGLMENITALMLGVLYGNPDTESKGKRNSIHPLRPACFPHLSLNN